MSRQQDPCQCGLPRWKHTHWASRPDRLDVIRAHEAQGLPAGYLFIRQLERVRSGSAVRDSSPTDPAEWDITEDGFRFGEGDRVYDYYDGRWVFVLEDPAETHRGWFDVADEPGGRPAGSLNSVRVASRPPDQRTMG